LGENAPIRTAPTVVPSAIERDVLALSEEDFDLVAFLVASHHGKVRASMHATPADQDATARLGVVTIRGLRDGDALPPIPFGSDADALLPATTIDLSPASMGLSARTGASWADRVLGLVARLGPFQLAWLEALLRAADVRASRLTTPDPMLQKEGS
jgi:CRISPR-associated endonuclease/helicase Cas3